MRLDSILSALRKLVPKPVFRFFQPYYHLFLAVTGNIRYGFPGRKMIIIGVTGTNGKSTTAELINSVLKENGLTTGMLSTVAFEIAGKRSDNTTSRTTLGRWQLQRKLAEMVHSGCTHAVLEVASEGLVMHRLWSIPFDIAIFTNLSPEHLNTHGTMKEYRDAKGLLFAGLAKSRHKSVSKTIIVNADDPQAKYFYHFEAEEKLTFGLSKGEIFATDIILGDKTEYKIVSGDKKYPIVSELAAKFNIYNVLAAFAVGQALHLSVEKTVKGIEKVKAVKGRMELVENERGIRIIIDYAVTPDSFENLFTELRRTGKGRIIAVFGATGDRDKEKRPLLGEVAAKMTNYIILTDEESYSENPAVIVDSIAEGVERVRKSNYEIILKRKDAIRRALEIADEGDTVVVTGMGHEKFRNIGGEKRIPWDEAEIIKEILTKL